MNPAEPDSAAVRLSPMLGPKRWWPLALVGAALLAGCKPSEEIRSYTVEPAPEKPATAPDGDKLRMLAGIIPLTEKTSYFVRFLGPVEVVSQYEADFNFFFSSLLLTDDPAKPLTWKMPPGWKLGKPIKERVVTLTPEAGPETVVMYVSQPFGGEMLSNVNRWRTDFVGIKPVSAEELPKIAEPVQLGPTKAYRFDLRGPGGSGRMGGTN